MKIEDWLSHKQGMTFQYKMEKFQYALDLLHHPELQLPVVHVAGTNGKGSTIAFLSQLAQEHGLRTGAFVSPHLVSVHDRFLVNGTPISDEEFLSVAQEIQNLEVQVSEKYEPFSYFETMTLIMFVYFRRQQLDLALIEVGIGGLHDVTNVVSPLVSVITSIGLDHQEILGSSLTAIARQKAGIIKEKVPVVVGPLENVALQEVKEVARIQQAPFYSYGRDFQGNMDWELSLNGAYQLENAAVAVKAFSLFMRQSSRDIQPEKVEKALRETHWPGRLEMVHQKPAIYLDGAHNLPAVERLIEFIKSRATEQVTILFSALHRKDYSEMLELFQVKLPKAQIILTNFAAEDSLVASDSLLPFVNDYESFIHKWCKQAGQSDVLYITGSLYFISEVRQLFSKNKSKAT